MPRRGIAVAVIVIAACLVSLALTTDFLVDWAWFSAIGHLDVFQTILGGKSSSSSPFSPGLPSSCG